MGATVEMQQAMEMLGMLAPGQNENARYVEKRVTHAKNVQDCSNEVTDPQSIVFPSGFVVFFFKKHQKL